MASIAAPVLAGKQRTGVSRRHLTMSKVVESPSVDREILALAVRVVHQAGQLTVERFHAGEQVRLKPDGTVVTQADLAIEELIRTELIGRTPEDGIVGEEHGTHDGRSGRRWVIDPLDGTRFFTRRIPVFTNLLAYEDEHGSAIGVINMPMQRELVFAGRGLGCWLLDGSDPDLASARQVRVSDVQRLGGATVHGTYTFAWTTDLLTALHQQTLLQSNRGDDPYAVAMLVTGRADAVVSVQTGQHWDWAPLPVIVSEAAGTISDLTGNSLPGDGTALAAGPSLHEQLLHLVAGLAHTRDWQALGDPDELGAAGSGT
jgi:histidinol-phosphatase